MKKVSTTVTYGVLILAAAVMCFPVLFSLALSFSDLNDILAGDYIPDSLNFTNYINAFQTQPLLHYMLNSAIVGVLSTALEIVFALLAAYAIVFIPFRAKKVVFLLMMATMMIPGEVLVITNFQTIRSWDMLNTYQGLILPGLASTFGIFLFRQNMLQIPLELKEASTVAGVSEFGFFWKIVAPMVVNTVVIGLRQLKNTEAVSDYGMMAAGAMVTSLPTLLLIFFGQKRLQEGMTKGAIK